MRTKGILAGTAIVALLGLALLFAGRIFYQDPREPTCRVCSRPIHEGTRTVATVDGLPEVFCCPACVLTDHIQTGKTVRITSFSDFENGNTIAPEKAFLVRGSEVNPCLSNHVLMGDHKEVRRIEFDRCSPSILAFTRIEDARTFMESHGGTLLSMSELLNLESEH